MQECEGAAIVALVFGALVPFLNTTTTKKL